MKFLLAIAFVPFALRRLLTYLHIYQQEEYQPIRFIKWMISSRSLDMRVSAALLAGSGLERAMVLSPILSRGAIAIVFLWAAYAEKDPRSASKKPLVITGRATRIYWIAVILVVLVCIPLALLHAPLIAWLIPVQALPFTLALANLLLVPYEKHVQQRFWNEAHQKLRALKPTVIGITGSYGKTSTKHLLGHILEVHAPTLITPGSVNTPMGIARIVRERLGSHHRFFVCEMGAYGPGSIARLCRLAPPDVGVLTAIGMAHYERFKSLETVAKAKLELAEAVARGKGDVILFGQVLEFEDARQFRSRYPEKTLVVGDDAASTFQLLQSRQTLEGIETEVGWKGTNYCLRAPIFGQHHIQNMAVAFATACALGIAPDDAVTALASTPQITHRLEVKPGVNGSRLIDDAYNSNPVGFASALRLLNTLALAGGRRICVTPGMVELGTAHEEEHRKIGKLAAELVDVLLPVLPERISALTEAFQLTNSGGEVVPCPSFAAAQGWLESNVGPNDVVLIENDLPDLYEKRLKL